MTTKTATATTASATTCTTNGLGLVFPQPSGSECGVPAYLNSGNDNTVIIQYTSGVYTLTLEKCKDIWLVTL